jgi:hypothetical protein
LKKSALDKALLEAGWWKYGQGSKHEKWTNGDMKTTVPRHREINEYTARAKLKLATSLPRKEMTNESTGKNN